MRAFQHVFQHVSKENITEILSTLDSKKVIQSADIPTKVLVIFSQIISLTVLKVRLIKKVVGKRKVTISLCYSLKCFKSI